PESVRSFHFCAPTAAATSGSLRSSLSLGQFGKFSVTWASRSNRRRFLRLAEAHDDRDIIQASPDFATCDRHSFALMTDAISRPQAGFVEGLRRR
ncbi:MAG: hypothetical protein WCQ91_07915, partial [Planctomycetota bacterium]